MSAPAKLVEVAIVGNGDKEAHEKDDSCNEEEDIVTLPPIISLPEVQVPTLEEEEVELIKLRAKLFRYDARESPPEWKERGTGDVKLLRHKDKHTVRVVMRRDKTLKICANHFVTPFMELKPNCGSDRAWVWSVLADFADETAKPELLAIKFANSDDAKKWKESFEEAKYIVANHCKLYTKTIEELCREEEDEDDEEDDSSDDDNETADDRKNAENPEDGDRAAGGEEAGVVSDLEKLKLEPTNISKPEEEAEKETNERPK